MFEDMKVEVFGSLQDAVERLTRVPKHVDQEVVKCEFEKVKSYLKVTEDLLDKMVEEKLPMNLQERLAKYRTLSVTVIEGLEEMDQIAEQTDKEADDGVINSYQQAVFALSLQAISARKKVKEVEKEIYDT